MAALLWSVGPGSARVLVAAPDRYLREVLAWVIEQDGRFDVVGRVADADAARASGPFDVAVVDLSLTDLGYGGSLIADLASRADRPAVAVLSPTGAVYLRHAAVHEGAAAFLVRPTDLPDVCDHLAALVDASFAG